MFFDDLSMIFVSQIKPENLASCGQKLSMSRLILNGKNSILFYWEKKLRNVNVNAMIKSKLWLSLFQRLKLKIENKYYPCYQLTIDFSNRACLEIKLFLIIHLTNNSLRPLANWGLTTGTAWSNAEEQISLIYSSVII